MATKYTRTPIMSFCELTTEQQEYARDQYDWDESIEDSSFVENPVHENEPLHLSNFMRTGGGIWDGIFGTSYFDGYFLKFHPAGDGALVAHRHF